MGKNTAQKYKSCCWSPKWATSSCLLFKPVVSLTLIHAGFSTNVKTISDENFPCDFSTLPTHPLLSWIRKQPMASSRKLRQWLCWVGFICGKEGLLPRRWWGMERRAPFFQTGSQSPQPPMDRRARKPTPFINGERQVHFHEQCVEYWQLPVGQK